MHKSYHRLIVQLRKRETTTSSQILVQGKTVHNPIPMHPDVCPINCRKSPTVQIAHLLTRHHADESIGLFDCEGCDHILFKAPIVPTNSMEPPSIEATCGLIKVVDSKSVRVIARESSKRVTLPKEWIGKIEMGNLNMHLLKARGWSYILIEIPS